MFETRRSSQSQQALILNPVTGLDDLRTFVHRLIRVLGQKSHVPTARGIQVLLQRPSHVVSHATSMKQAQDSPGRLYMLRAFGRKYTLALAITATMRQLNLSGVWTAAACGSDLTHCSIHKYHHQYQYQCHQDFAVFCCMSRVLCKQAKSISDRSESLCRLLVV